MAFNFPTSPSDGQEYTSANTTYIYRTSVGAWLLASPQYRVFDVANAAFDKANSANVLAFTAVQNTAPTFFLGTSNNANYVGGNTAQQLNTYADSAALVYAIALG